MTKNISRRKFTKAAAASSVFSLIPGKVLGANEKVNVAFIGCGGQGGGIAHNVYNTKHVNAVALCDVAMGTGHTAGTEKKFNGIELVLVNDLCYDFERSAPIGFCA